MILSRAMQGEYVEYSDQTFILDSIFPMHLFGLQRPFPKWRVSSGSHLLLCSFLFEYLIATIILLLFSAWEKDMPRCILCPNFLMGGH